MAKFEVYFTPSRRRAGLDATKIRLSIFAPLRRGVSIYFENCSPTIKTINKFK